MEGGGGGGRIMTQGWGGGGGENDTRVGWRWGGGGGGESPLKYCPDNDIRSHSVQVSINVLVEAVKSKEYGEKLCM